MKSEELIERQKSFVEWLEAEGMYNPQEAADTMQKMYRVWKQCGINEGHIEEIE